MLAWNETQKLIKKYKISSKDGAEAGVIILDGIVLKDRYNPLQGEGEYSLNFEGQTKKIIIGCQTEYGDLRVYKNF